MIGKGYNYYAEVNLMDVNTIIQLINGVGFPITACIGMGFFIVWDKKNRREDMREQQSKQEEMFKKLSESVDNNTRTIQRLIEKMGEEDEIHS